MNSMILGVLSRELGEKIWAFKYRLEAEKLMNQLGAPSFRHGEKILLKPGIDLQDISISSGPALEIRAKNNVELALIHGTGYSLISPEIFSRFSFHNDSWFYYFNEAYTTNFVFIRLPAGKNIGTAMLSMNISGLPAVASVFILAETGSRGTLIIEKTSQAKSPSYLGLNVKVLAEDDSNITVVGVQDFDRNTYCFEERVAKAGRNSTVNWVSLNVGSAFHSASYVTNLVGEGAVGNIRCLYAASGSQNYDLYTKAVHFAPHTESNLFTRGVVNGAARALSRGMIAITPNASASKGYEKQDALILSEDAEADAIPNLEIENYDVKCSHGSSVGQIDPESMYYLMSRGLSEDDAKKLIIMGYFQPVMELLDGGERTELESVLQRAIG